MTDTKRANAKRTAAPILAKPTDQRLAAIIRRFGGTPYVAPKPGVVELPSIAWYRERFGDGGQPELDFDDAG